MNQSKYTFNDPGADAPSGGVLALEWRDYVAILYERIWIAITVLIVAVVLSLLHVQRQTPIYRSSARILVEERPTAALNLQDVLAMNRSSLETFNTHIRAMSSRKMIAGALQAEGIKDNPDFLPLNLPEETRVDAALGKLRIVPVPSSRLIDVIVEHPNPEMAAKFADAVAEEYISQDLDIRMSKSMEVVEWLRNQSETYRERLEVGLLGLQEYREQQKAVSLEERQDVVVSKLKDLNQSLTSAENRARELKSEWELVSGASRNNPDVLIEIPVIASDEEVRGTYSSMKAKENELQLLKSRYLERHPTMEAAREELAVVSLAFRNACNSAVSRIEARYRAAETSKKNLAEALRQQEQEAFQLDRKLVTYEQLKRGVDADREVYEGMLARIREAHLAGDLRIDFIRLVDPARVSKHPARPSKQRTLTNGILAGLLLGIALSFGSHLVDNRLRRVDEVEGLFGLPVLAAVPHIRKGNESERRRISVLEPRSGPAEAFRTLRACLGLQRGGEKAKRILITSVSSSDGKSLVASNLAIVFAVDGEKTLLIDADMRRPTAHRALDENMSVPKDGLSGVLAGDIAWEDAIVSSETENLDMLFSGSIPENPAELLGSRKMIELMDEVSGKYDRIILDSPPVMGVSDPLVMLPLADGVLFVVHFGKTRRHAAKMALQQLRAGGTEMLGIVLDNMKIGRAGSYYYYYHHSEYYTAQPELSGRSKS